LSFHKGQRFRVRNKIACERCAAVHANNLTDAFGEGWAPGKLRLKQAWRAYSQCQPKVAVDDLQSFGKVRGRAGGQECGDREIPGGACAMGANAVRIERRMRIGRVHVGDMAWRRARVNCQ
jgi:hypothetical protein